MGTKIATASASGASKKCIKQLTSQIKDQLGKQRPALLTLFASTEQPLAELVHPLRKAFPGVTLVGASTAGEFVERGDHKGSAVLMALAGEGYEVHAGIGRSLKLSAEGAVQRATEKLPSARPGLPHQTAIMLLDPLAGNGEEAALIAASHFGDGVRLAGGAAGDDLKMTRTEVACNDEVATDAVVIAMLFSKSRPGIGVCHGHVPLSGPLKVTRSSGGTVHEIDGRPAWDVWMERTAASAKLRGQDPHLLLPGEVGAYLLRYEAGLAAGGSDYKIRAPLSKNPDGSLNFATGIPNGAMIRITESEPARQVDSAKEAARRARAEVKGKVAGALVFDCICRNLILGSEFNTAVRQISSELGNVPLAGFETYGEIALNDDAMSGFHNTTTVVLAFPD